MNRWFRSPICVIALTIFCCIAAANAFGNIIITGPAAGNHISQLPATDADDLVMLNPDPVTYLAGATAAMQAALKADFALWNFTYAAGLGGTLNINQYKATTTADDNGGGLLEVTYTRAANDPTIANLHWIQMVVTNRPLGGGPTTGYIDPRPNDDTLPFYWTLAEDANAADGNKTATTYHFFDNSSRNAMTDPDLITWRGELMLASWDGNDPGNVTVYDGIRWGWDLTDTVPEQSALILCLTGCLVIALWRAFSSRGQLQRNRGQ